MPKEAIFNVRVDCYAGYRGDEAPKRFWLGERKRTVTDIRDRWLAPDHRYFKLKGDDGGVYIVRHDPHAACWELVFFKQLSVSTS